MSDLSNFQGRANEYAYIQELKNTISQYRNVLIVEDSSFEASKRAWNSIDEELQNDLISGAIAGVKAILDFEPIITDPGNDQIKLKIQSDKKGEEGDVRDVLITRNGANWEIGLSVKHNHFAVKHSRLAKNLDFGKKWFDVACSEKYWEDIQPIFSFLDVEKSKKNKWSNISHKDDSVYVPLLEAFISEVKRSYQIYGSIIPRKMVEYLLGEYDFYKVIGIDHRKVTQIQTFNFRGQLNKQGQVKKTKTIISVSKLPTRIVSIDFKPNSKNTVEMYMDEGWQFSFRIHSASTLVESSLKFDIQIKGMPSSILVFESKW